ncbi:MAG: hypothetical protein ABI988_14855, partial [Nitrospirota bacterium]
CELRANMVGGTKTPGWSIAPCLVAQVFLVRRREAQFHAKLKRRFWYTAVMAFLAYLLMTSPIIENPFQPQDKNEIRGSLIFGGIVLFQILILPVSWSCYFRRATIPDDPPSEP